MATRKKAKKARVKKASRKTSPAQPAASTPPVEPDELAKMKKQLEDERREFERQKEQHERQKHLDRINTEMAAGTPPVVPPPPEKTVAQQRDEARQERRRKRDEAKARVVPPPKVSSLEEARAKKAQPVNPAAQEDKQPVTLPMDELHKYKLEVLNRNYVDALKKVKEPLVAKYNQMLEAEAKELAQKDPECVKAKREQVMCLNELVELLTPQLPEGYAITQALADKSVIVAQYVPNRAGKPLTLPGLVPEEG